VPISYTVAGSVQLSLWQPPWWQLSTSTV